MIVYAETNLILELTLGQEESESCQQIVDWARDGRLSLRIPVYALHEAQNSLRRKEKEDTTLLTIIQQQIREFRRMRPFPGVVDALETARSALRNAAECKIERLKERVQELAPAVTYFPMTHDAVSSVQMFRVLKVTSGEDDLLIFSSVMSDLEERQDAGDVAPSIFVTRNSRDFSDRAGRLLRTFSCDLFTSYEAAVGRLKSEFTP